MSGPSLYHCTVTTEADVKALDSYLREFPSTERAFQDVLIQNPGILGALGFTQYSPEFPVIKRDEFGILTQLPRRDRIDILAAKTETSIAANSAPQYQHAHIVELKRSDAKILERIEGLRLSDTALQAVQQLDNYQQWLTTVEENRTALKQFDWNVFLPAKFLVMGSEREFIANPHALEPLREHFIQKHGVHLLLSEDLIRRAEEARVTRSVRVQAIFGSSRADNSPFLASSGSLAGMVMLHRQTLAHHQSEYGTIVLKAGTPEGLVHVREKRSQPVARRLKIPYAEAVIDFSKWRGLWKPIKSGIVVSATDEPVLLKAIQERHEKVTPTILAKREKRKISERQLKMQEFADRIRQIFPKMPLREEYKIAKRATETGSRRVGVFTTIENAEILATAAHVRWEYTDYSEILDELHEQYRAEDRSIRFYLPPPAHVAKARVEKLVQKILKEWGLA